jgi:hypothetical protein
MIRLFNDAVSSSEFTQRLMKLIELVEFEMITVELLNAYFVSLSGVFLLSRITKM